MRARENTGVSKATRSVDAGRHQRRAYAAGGAVKEHGLRAAARCLFWGKRRLERYSVLRRDPGPCAIRNLLACLRASQTRRWPPKQDLAQFKRWATREQPHFVGRRACTMASWMPLQALVSICGVNNGRREASSYKRSAFRPGTPLTGPDPGTTRAPGPRRIAYAMT